MKWYLYLEAILVQSPLVHNFREKKQVFRIIETDYFSIFFYGKRTHTYIMYFSHSIMHSSICNYWQSFLKRVLVRGISIFHFVYELLISRRKTSIFTASCDLLEEKFWDSAKRALRRYSLRAHCRKFLIHNIEGPYCIVYISSSVFFWTDETTPSYRTPVRGSSKYSSQWDKNQNKNEFYFCKMENKDSLKILNEW